MRIAYVAPFGLRAKGTARARALPLARAVAARGHQTALFVPPYDSPQDSGLCWRDGAVPVIHVTLPRLATAELASAAGPRLQLATITQAAAPTAVTAGSWWHARLAFRLWVAVRAWRPEVVHVFKPKGPSGLVATALWLTRGAGWPTRLVIDSDDWEGPAGWNDDPRAGYSPVQRRVFAWQERHGLAHADVWTVASDCLRRRAIEFDADPARVFTLPNGIGGAWLAVASGPCMSRPGPPTDAGSVLLYTRFAGVRVEDVAAVWRRVVELVPAARLSVVGRGLGGEEWQLAQAAPNVEVVGWLEAAEMPTFFAQHTVAVVPWADTPANRARSSAKVLELMAAGLPIVGYAVGELPLTLAGAGLLAPPGDAHALAAALAGLLANPERAAALGQAAQTRVRTEFTWDRLADIALQAYARPS